MNIKSIAGALATTIAVMVFAMACELSSALTIKPAISPTGESTPSGENTKIPVTPRSDPGIGRVLVDVLEIRSEPSESSLSSDTYWTKGETMEIIGCMTDRFGDVWVGFRIASVSRWSAATHGDRVLIEQDTCQ